MPMPSSFLKGLPDSQEIRMGLRSPWIWTVLILSLCLDSWVWRQAETRLRMQSEARFEGRVGEIRAALQARLQSQELVLRGGMGLHAAHDSLDRDAWRSYIEALQLDRNQAGIQGVGYAVRIRPEELASWEGALAQRRISVWPKPESHRDMTPIVLLEPATSRNQRAFGYDMFSEPVRRKAMELARDSGDPTLSGKVTLVQEYPWDKLPQNGFLIYMPVYRPGLPTHTVEERRMALEGFVYSPFRTADLIGGIIARTEADGVGFSIFDGEGTEPENLLYRSPGERPLPSGWAARLVRVETLPLYGHAWTVRYAAGERFLAEADSSRPVIILVLGMAVSLLLASAMLILTTTRHRAQRLAEQMTAELRSLQANLEKLVAQRTRELELANRELGAEMERRAAREEQLRQAQKMEAIGRLAGGVAHDFNNLLTAINGYAALSMDGVDKSSPIRANLEEIRRAGDMAASLTRQLLAYSRKQILMPRLVSLNEAVGDMGRMLQRLIGGEITVDLKLAKERDMVKVDPSQLQQALINLSLNARDAMPEGGRLTIETGTEELVEADPGGLVGEAARTGEGAIPPGRYAVLTVRDTGHGMEEDVKARLFEPYFTTKQLGSDKGTGLGLSMVYGIVRQSGGHIQVFSEPGLGTAFRILFPLQSEHASLAGAA